MSSAQADPGTLGSGVSRADGERGNVRGQTTRLLILSAAERLFAERGVSGVPLREIGKAAGQRNHAAVQYHFGDRDEVVRAIMEYRGAESERTRAEIVAALVLGEAVPSVADVVSAFVRPLALHIEADNHYLRFLSLLITEEGGYEGLVGVHTGGQVMTLRALLVKLLPTLPEEVLFERWWVALTSAVHTLARYQTTQRKRELASADLERRIEDLVAFLAAGLAAPHDGRGGSAPRPPRDSASAS
ncbi:TetR family transcriptional regulator [Leucobacter weissii]|uniref:TetR family transcriptional regulator n=1 Tax=Leucobacter weissii TaxID=1983706 RepID=A0A939MIP9_9MICO|nr:TetR/AcrR family transcriptional regulator [Leucobacter weissii]MBO1901321.1 TetR family transcriptional regulator [Leucobacter weissii]